MAGSTLKKIPRQVWILGFVSLLMDISSEMIHSLLPLFMVTSLGAGALAVGLMEGLAESLALIMKVFSGVLSDYWGKRKGLALLGYGLGAFTKPVFALSAAPGLVLFARLLDRTGKGLRGTPRDALVADVTPPELRGAAFGLRQSLDAVGGFVGPLMAALLMLLWADDFRAVFWVAVIPAFLCVALLFFGINEPERPAGIKPVNPVRRENLRRLNRTYRHVVFIGTVFTLARFSPAFLVLRAQEGGMPLALIPISMMLMYLTYSLSAYPLGRLSDHMSHRSLLSLGIVLLLLSDLVFALSPAWPAILIGVTLWGCHMGATQGLFNTMIAREAPADLRGTAFGFFNLMCGLAMLLASLLAGLLWESAGSSFTFLAGALFAAASLLLLRKKAS